MAHVPKPPDGAVVRIHPDSGRVYYVCEADALPTNPEAPSSDRNGAPQSGWEHPTLPTAFHHAFLEAGSGLVADMVRMGVAEALSVVLSLIHGGCLRICVAVQPTSAQDEIDQLLGFADVPGDMEQHDIVTAQHELSDWVVSNSVAPQGRCLRRVSW